VIVEGGRAAGVVLASGEAVRASRVVANVNPKLCSRAWSRRALADDFRARIAATVRLGNVPHERRACPSCPTSPRCRATTRSRITRAASSIAPSLGYMERAYFDAQTSDGRRRRSSRC
jgi:hypothetical protein